MDILLKPLIISQNKEVCSHNNYETLITMGHEV